MDLKAALDSGVDQWQARFAPTDYVSWMAQRGEELWSKQREIGAALEVHDRVAVHSAHGIGKSFTAASLVAWWVDRGPADQVRVITTAPSTDQVHGILWQEITKLHMRLGLRGQVQMTDKWVIGPLLLAEGRKPPDYSPSSFQGSHAWRLLIVLDEACGIPEWLWDAATSMATGPNNRILAIGNPDDPNSHFARICDPGNKGNWHVIGISLFDSPHFTGEKVSARLLENLTTRDWQEKRLEEWGADSPKYIAKVLGRFPKDAPDQVVPAGALYGCHLSVPRAPEELVPVELGVDVGAGGDKTVIRERCGMQLRRKWELRSDEPERTWRLVLRAIRETGARSVKIDGNGIGLGVVGEGRNSFARGEHQARIHSVLAQQQPHNKQLYANLRAEIWWVIGREGSQKRDWDLSRAEDGDTLDAQLMWPRWKEDVRGRIQLEDKAEIRKRTGGSPDDAEAALLAFYVPPSAATDYMEALMAATR